MRAYRGAAPCVGCGTTGADRARKTKDSLCHVCKDTLQRGIKARKEEQELSDKHQGEIVRLRLGSDNILNGQLEWETDGNFVKATEKTLYLSSYRGGDRPEKEGGNGQMSRAFLSLLKHLAIPNFSPTEKVKHQLTKGRGDYENGVRITLHFTVVQAEYIFELWDAIAKYAKRADKEAYDRGKNLLMGLASGDMSIREFNEKTF